LTLDDVLNTVAGRKGLLMDVKGVYHGRWNLEFARTLARKIDEHKAAGWTQVCGQFWPVLDSLRTEAPGLEVRYSIERPLQWEKFARLLDEDESVRPICIERRLLNEERSLFLDERGVSVYCWTVDNHDEAEQLVHAGVDGIISNDLGLLAHLGTAVRDEVNGAGLEGGDDARASLDR
jgi:glycerophosphoryl diester phosphodiesterase